MSIMSYNGGAVLAMSGDHCVAICSDLRFGRELQTISTDFTKVTIHFISRDLSSSNLPASGLRDESSLMGWTAGTRYRHSDCQTEN